MFGFLAWLSSYFYVFILHICRGNSFPKPLSEAKEKEYLEKFKNGDINARNKLIEHNLRLVAHIIKKYYAKTDEQDDLVSIGSLGLIKALNSYNPDKGKLSSYASRCIENEILMHFRNSKKSAQDMSLSDSIDTDKDGNPLTLIDVLSVEDDFTREFEDNINLSKLNRYINEVLDERERRIIIMRYGLKGQNPLTQREVAEKLNISRSYISRIEKRALENLRKRYYKPD